MDYDRLRELQAKFDENPRRYFAPLANEYRKGGNPKRAIEICRAHLAQMPGHMSGQVVYGQSLFEGGEFEEARKVFEGALLLDPENLIALRSLGDLALQAGNNAEARTWYTKLLDADPKDASVISLISQIDEAGDSEATAIADAFSDSETEAVADAAETPATTSEFTVDFSFVDQPPGAAETPSPGSGGAAEAAPPEAAATPREDAVAAVSESAAPPSESDSRQSAPPLGLEHHYPTESAAPAPEPEPMGPDRDALDTWVPPVSAPVHVAAPGDEIPDERPLVSNQPEPPPLFGNVSSAPEPAPPITNVAEATPASFAGTNPEPFVNETMAQLYLQQGYKQLALRVYRQLSERKPDEQSFKDRIAEIEASQAEPESAPQARRDEPPSIESPTPEPAAPRSPSTESPIPHGPGSQPSSVESPGYDRSTIDRQPTSPSSEPDSIESPVREEPRAEPEGIAARQPSIREFFATLGRRRPPRPTPAPVRAWSDQPAPTSTPVPDAGNSSSLDQVFAGAKVSATDARAASTLAGAFSSSARSSNPPSPAASPTPRANPRLQTQESEEDVAKFRAWLDGLTGE
jgi:tetratricopeptide (TPR) repeat protein